MREKRKTDYVSMREEKETAQIVYAQNRCSINSQSGQRVFLT